MLIFIRHAETDWNHEGRIQGTIDTCLTTTGRERAMQLALQFRQSDINLIWTSPLRRAGETAKILSTYIHPLGKPIRIRQLQTLMERPYGIYQGKRLKDLGNQFATQEELVHGDGVETWFHLQRRVMQTLLTISKGPDQAIIVTHGGWLKAMHAILQTGLHRVNGDNLTGYALKRSNLISILSYVNQKQIRDEIGAIQIDQP